MGKKLVLASQSPRRRELMTYLNLPFEGITPASDEVMKGASVMEMIENIAYDKASQVFKLRPNNLVIGADTVVVIDGEILGKPITPKRAKEMLMQLSGREHEVITSVAMLSSKKEIVFSSVARVEFYELDEATIDAYIETREPLDKAGAYTIQAGGALFVKRIEGDFYTIMGLPIGEINQLLKGNDW
jgi:septum formation protein